MCGVVGIFGQGPVNQMLYDALTMLQHRGQDAAGIVTCQDGRLFLRKDNGMVRDVFHTRHMRRLIGNYGIGHVRYPTAGSSSSAEAQPFYVNSPYGITLAHNGNLTNAKKIKQDLFETDLRHINTDSDSEVLLNVFAHELDKAAKVNLNAQDLFQAVSRVHQRCQGAYAVVAMMTNHGIVAFRDPHGIRPLIYGSRQSENGKKEYVVASESVAITALGFKVERDVLPGEAIFIDINGNFYSQQCSTNPSYTPCIFEYVYFARPDAIIDKISVYKARLRMGEKLAGKILKEWGKKHDIDVVIPIPDTSRTAALELANILGVTFREGFMKNRYIGRTFIMPGQQLRKKSVRQKLNPVELEFKNKNVLLVDDSIVRGTTCQEIIQMAREAGAKKVFFASAAPEVKYPNVYGIDMPVREELIASGRSVPQICKMIGADRLIFQDLGDLQKAIRSKRSSVDGFDCAVFDGHYVTSGIDEKYLTNLEIERSEAAKCEKDNYIDMSVDIAGVDLTGIKPDG